MRIVEKDVFRVALVGCGAISGNHVAAILAAGQTVAALCDVEEEKARALAAATGLLNVPIFTDFETMLESARPDVLHICTPHDLHAPMTLAALKRGIHVLCEKPLAITEEQLCTVLAAERESRALLAVCHQNRYEPNMRRLKALAEQDPPVGGYANVVWKRDARYYASGAWRGTLAHEGGGVLINQALHTLDLMQWVCGMPDRVTAHLFNDFHRGVTEVEDVAACTFESPDGANAGRWQFFATTAAAADFPIQIVLRLSSGKLVEAQNSRFTVDHSVLESGADLAAKAGPGKWVWGDGHKALVADFYAHVSKNSPFWLNGEEGAKVVRLILAAARSRGQTVPIKEMDK